MARKVNTSFTGSTDKQTDPGGLTQEQIVENAVGDTALVHDMVTGDNSPVTTINHTGSGAGVPLGVPLGASVTVLTGRGATPQNRVNSQWSGAYDNNAFLFAVPFFMPHGQTEVSASLKINDADQLQMEIRDTSWAEAGEPTESTVEGSWWNGNATGLTEGTLYFLCVTCPLGSVEPVRTWAGLRIYFPGRLDPEYVATMPEPGATNPAWPQSPVASQASGGATIMDQEDWDAAFFAQDRAIHAQLLDRLNKNQNALAEYLTGAPAGGNAEYTLKPTSEDDPSEGAFHDHSQSSYSNEGEIDFPVLIAPLGAVENTSTSVDYITDNWGAPQSRDTNANVLANDVVIMPDLPDTTSLSRLKFVMLIVFPNNASKAAPQVQVQAHWGGGSGTARIDTSMTQMGSTDYYYAEIGGAAHVGRIDFGGGELNQLRVTVDDNQATQADKARYVGYAWYFDRDA